MSDSVNFIEDYIKFITEELAKFEKIGDLTRMNEVPIDKVYKAMANYYSVCLALSAEYQRAKIEKINAEIEYEANYAEWFQEAKHSLYFENEKKQAKPSLKEIEQCVIAKHRIDYFAWKRKLASTEARCDFFVRLRETLNKYDSILVGLATSMRSELRALSIEERAENTAQRFSGFVNDDPVQDSSKGSPNPYDKNSSGEPPSYRMR